MADQKQYTHKESWGAFRETGLLWLVNTILHLFGWALAVEVNNETGEITDAYPLRVKFRGFPGSDNDEGYQKVSKWMAENAGQLLREARDEA